jgi:hypothetical protein
MLRKDEINRIITSLCSACYDGDLNTVSVLTPLVPEGNINNVNSRGIDVYFHIQRIFVRQFNILGQTALYCSANCGSVEIMSILCNRKDINLDYRVPAHGGTPLHGILILK